MKLEESAVSKMLESVVKTEYPLTQEQIDRYHQDGFVLIPKFFSPEELKLLQRSLEQESEKYDTREITHIDGDGQKSGILYWSHLGDSLLGVLPRIARIVDGAEALLGEECYHWHSKIARKKPNGSRIEWHQDYGSWYHEGCIFPKMLTCAISPGYCNEENGYLQVVKGSHLLTRLDIVKIGNTVGSQASILDRILDQMEIVGCEMSQGDALFFHANLLHGSAANRTNATRSLLHCAYNGISNAPFIQDSRKHHHYQPLQKLPDSILSEYADAPILEEDVDIYRPQAEKDKFYMNDHV